MITNLDQLRVLIDGNIVDALAADPETMALLQSLQAQNVVEVLITFVHMTELKNTPDQERRKLLLTTLLKLNPRR